jgi:hypothetical protein
MAEPGVKIALAADLDRARSRLARSAGALRGDLDIPAHLKHSFHGNKAAYIGGATLFGLLLSKLPARKKKIYVERKGKETAREVEKAGIAGMALMLLQFLFKTFRPMLTTLVAKQVTDFLKSRSRTSP